MDSWLRPMLARKQTAPSNPSIERSPSFIEEDNNENEEEFTKIHSSSRISPQTTFHPSSAPPTPILDEFPSFRQPETVWNKPSSDQMVEVLKVVMMTQSSMEPVPIEYNSTILHVLEAYYDLRMQLQTNLEAITLLNQNHQNDIKEFEGMADQWHKKENDYQAEIKRLEVLLSKTRGGLESVMMARSTSVVNGSKKASDIIRQGIGTVKHRNQAPSQDIDELSWVRKYVPKVIGFAKNTKEVTNKIDAVPQPASQNTEEQPGATEPGKGKGKERDSELERIPPITSEGLARPQQQLGERKPKFSIRTEDSSESSNESTSSSSNDDFPNMGSDQGIGLGIHDKPLPEIPIGFADRSKQTTLDKFLRRKQVASLADSSPMLSVPRQLSFSFQPGDDVALLFHRLESDRLNRHTIDSHLDQVSREEVSSGSSTLLDQISSHNGHSLTISASTQPNIRPRMGNPENISRDLQDYDGMKREDSTSSVVTAVRDNSGRSSVASGSRKESYTGRQKLDRSTGGGKNGTAVTAAAKAFVGAESRIASGSSGGGSDTRTRNRAQYGG